MLKLTLIISMFWLASGCSVTIPPPEDVVTPKSEPVEDWTNLLSNHVDKQGRVDFKGVQKSPKKLNNYVAWVGKYSPQSHPDKFPTADDRMAYYLNSYNALAMYGVIQKGIPKDLDGFFKRLGFFFLTKFQIGGKFQTLYDYENNLIRKLGDPRIHFALNCMSVGCPRMLDVPYEAKTLNKTLDDCAIEFFNSETYVQVDSSKKIARISQILEFFTEDFVNPKQSPNLIAYVNKYRKDKIPETYAVEFIPYDWTIDTQ